MTGNKADERVTIQVAGGPVTVVDRTELLAAADAERVVVVAVPCGAAAVSQALAVRPAALFLRESTAEENEAGLGAADASGVPCAAVKAEAPDIAGGHAIWASGKVTAANAAARRRGVKPAMTVQQAAGLLMAWTRVM